MPREASVDYRSGSGHLLQPLKSSGVPARRVLLTSADVAFEGRGRQGPVQIGIELKTITDLVDSMLTKRLQGRQIPAMVKTYDIRYLIIEGVWCMGKSGEIQRWHWKKKRFLPLRRGCTYMALNRFLVTVEQFAGFHVRRTANTDETLQTIVDLFRWWGKKSHHGHLSYDWSRAVPPDRQLFQETTWVEMVAKDLPGIGWEKAHRVAQHFHSVADMVLADRHEWLKVDGIGLKTANSIRKAVWEKGAVVGK